MASLQTVAARSGETVSQHHMRTLSDVKRDVVDTIRQVVDIVSKYAGGALPEPARQRVRGFILHLPQRWASASRQGPEPAQPYPAGTGKRRSGRYGHGTAEGSSASNPYPTPVSSSRPGSPTHSRTTSLTSRAVLHPRNTPGITGSPTVASHGMSTIAANQAAQRILTLAMESLDMIRGVTGVFKESLDRADAYVSTSVCPPYVAVLYLDHQVGWAAQGRWNPEAKLGCPCYGVPPWLSATVHFGRQLSPTITFCSVFRRVFASTSPSLLEVIFGLLLLLPSVAIRGDVSLHANGNALNHLHRYYATQYGRSSPDGRGPRNRWSREW